MVREDVKGVMSKLFGVDLAREGPGEKERAPVARPWSCSCSPNAPASMQEPLRGARERSERARGALTWKPR